MVWRCWQWACRCCCCCCCSPHHSCHHTLLRRAAHWLVGWGGSCWSPPLLVGANNKLLLAAAAGRSSSSGQWRLFTFQQPTSCLAVQCDDLGPLLRHARGAMVLTCHNPPPQLLLFLLLLLGVKLIFDPSPCFDRSASLQASNTTRRGGALCQRPPSET